MISSPESPPDNRSGPPTAGASETSAREKSRPTKVVRYGAMGWVGEFTHKPGAIFRRGERVVIQTDRGIELGEPVGVARADCDLCVPREQLQIYTRNSGSEFCRPRAGRILRVANEQDLNEQQHLNAHVREDIDFCAELAANCGLDMKIITAEHLLGGERIVFYFGSPARVDFREMVKELAHRHRTRIEMRQVGARDEARLVADYEVCGCECCCRNFLKKLRPVNMKMAKLQKSTLDPSKVSGRCGRLRCCLRYEHEGYEELAQRLPRAGTAVGTDSGPAKVLDRQILTQLLVVRIDADERVVTIPIEEIKPLDALPEPTREAAAKPPEPPAPAPAARGAPTAEAEPGATEPKERRPKRRRGRRRGKPRAEERAPTPPASERDPGGVTDEPRPESAESDAAGEAAPTGKDRAASDDSTAKGNGQPKRRRRGRRRRPRRGDGGRPASGGGAAGSSDV